ncbi:MAG: DUF1846 family protein, partial [Oscillospiraceae bacterium]|nr:DUF1846 family protein [Oscillospiraceae bacterium]
AAKQEIIRRYYNALCQLRQGKGTPNAQYKLELLMKRCNTSTADRKVVSVAIEKSKETGEPAVAMELPDGTIVTGKTSDLLGASSACVLNALKALGDIPKATLLFSRDIVEPIQHLKLDFMGNKNPRLHTDETLIALAICSVHDENAAKAMEQLNKLKGCEAHSTVILSRVDENVFQHLGVNITYEPVYQTKKLYHG